MWICVWVYAHECRYQKKPEDPSGAGITGGCEMPVVGAKNRTWVFWKAVCVLNHWTISLHSQSICRMSVVVWNFYSWGALAGLKTWRAAVGPQAPVGQCRSAEENCCDIECLSKFSMFSSCLWSRETGHVGCLLVFCFCFFKIGSWTYCVAKDDLNAGIKGRYHTDLCRTVLYIWDKFQHWTP